MLVVRKCSWCKGFLGVKLDPKQLNAFVKTTHGICPDCQRKLEKRDELLRKVFISANSDKRG
jgi:hypothetical protein